jgi:hypothetical protein
MNWFVLRAALFTTGARASKGCHLTQLPKPAPLGISRCYEPERHRDNGSMWCRLSFVDPSLGELDAFEPGIMRRLEGPPNAAQSSDSPDAFAFPAHYDAKFPTSATAGG